MVSPPHYGGGVGGEGLSKFIDTVNICFDGGSDDVGIGAKTIVEVVVVLHLHVYLTHIV